MPKTLTRIKIAAKIYSWEARLNKQGRLTVYMLPPADGGGTFEVAGINDRYHPEKAWSLREMLARGEFDAAERAAKAYIADYTQIVAKWTRVRAIEAYLRDCAWNRGAKGALRILQLALDVADDGKFGPVTKAALDEAMEFPDRLLLRLRYFREVYERRVAPPVGARAQLWPGLVARWDAALEFAQKLL
ncbi:MAG: hypothetical protein ACOYMN_08125 [Roseimicrobium sp.]